MEYPMTAPHITTAVNGREAEARRRAARILVSAVEPLEGLLPTPPATTANNAYSDSPGDRDRLFGSSTVASL